MRHILFAALAAAAMIGAAGCHGPEKGSGLAGTYEGTFPCADCGGKDICLTICGDGTYCLKYSYRDRDERQIEENGTYSILGSVLVETVTPFFWGKDILQVCEGESGAFRQSGNRE